MKRYYFIFSLLLCCVLAHGQDITLGGNISVEFVPKKVYDFATVSVYYDYTQSVFPGGKEKRYGETVLLIGPQYWGFMDWNSYKSDSLQDAYAAKGLPSSDLIETLTREKKEKGERAGYLYPMVANRSDGTCTIQMRATSFTPSYQYEEPLPEMAWKLENDSCKIKNLDCAKATCKFRGRSWTAWYTEQYDIPFGPYLFGGLPGLIVMLEDSIGDYSFKLSGIQATPNGRPIYLRNKKNLVIYTTRERAMQGVKNECGDVSKALLARSPSMARQHNGALLNTKKSVPYNPLELE